MRPDAKGVCRVALPVTLHLKSKLGFVPDHVAIIGAGAPDTERLESTRGCRDLLKGLDGESVFQVERLISIVDLELELAWP